MAATALTAGSGRADVFVGPVNRAETRRRHIAAILPSQCRHRVLQQRLGYAIGAQRLRRICFATFPARRPAEDRIRTDEYGARNALPLHIFAHRQQRLDIGAQIAFGTFAAGRRAWPSRRRRESARRPSAPADSHNLPQVAVNSRQPGAHKPDCQIPGRQPKRRNRPSAAPRRYCSRQSHSRR